MKKLWTVLVMTGLLAGNSFAQFDLTSFRIDGINTELAQIVNDEYSDWRHNPADILAISGHRFYTIASNLDGKVDTLGAPTSDTFQFGYVGNPFKDLLPITGQFGLLIHQDSDISASGLAGGFGAAGSTKVSDTDVTITDVDVDGTLTSTNDTALSTTRTGERYIETNEDVDSIDYGQNIGDNFKLGISVEKALDTSEEPIKATWESMSAAVGSTATNIEDNILNAKEEITTDDITLTIGGRLALSEKWNIGAMASMMPHTYEQERTSLVSINRNITSAAGNNPTTLVATGTDISSIEAETGDINGTIFSDSDATTSLSDAGTGFAWTGGTTLGTLANIPNDASGKVEDEGTAIAYDINTYYNLTDVLKLYGAVAMINEPYDRKINASNDVSATWRDIGNVNGTDITRITVTDTYTGTGTNEEKAMKVTLGAEQDLPGNVKIGYGVIYGTSDGDVNVTYTRSYEKFSTFDATGDGLRLAESDTGADTSSYSTYSDKWKAQTETETLLYQFPVGCELQPFKKLKLRLGSTHEVREITTKTKAQIVEDGATTTITANAGAATTTVVRYGGNQNITGDASVQTEVKTKTRNTTYYYGAGYQWSENLCFDILGFGSDGGAGILGIESWKISATLMFGGAEDYTEGL